MAKIAKHSVSLTIPGPSGRVLLVLRPSDDDTLPGLWTLPAVTTHPGEREDDAVRRAGREKLGVQVLPGALIGETETDGPERLQRMRTREATIEGNAPSVPQPGPGTQYLDYRWADPAELKPAARAGSLGSQVLLRAREVPW